MKITKSQLKQIIKEELSSVMTENEITLPRRDQIPASRDMANAYRNALQTLSADPKSHTALLTARAQIEAIQEREQELINKYRNVASAQGRDSSESAEKAPEYHDWLEARKFIMTGEPHEALRYLKFYGGRNGKKAFQKIEQEIGAFMGGHTTGPQSR